MATISAILSLGLGSLRPSRRLSLSSFNSLRRQQTSLLRRQSLVLSSRSPLNRILQARLQSKDGVKGENMEFSGVQARGRRWSRVREYRFGSETREEMELDSKISLLPLSQIQFPNPFITDLWFGGEQDSRRRQLPGLSSLLLVSGSGYGWEQVVNREMYEGYVPMAYNDYLKTMKRNGEWGDHVTLQAAADWFGVRMFVITSFKDTCYIEILPHLQKSNRLICLSFWAEVHYNSIILKESCRY
ncbi:Uncharacterized protein Rs2_00243 [Raphanus sativus]|nr:Uncharacterized protein Rs2_00243 [Raphanus sativus]